MGGLPEKLNRRDFLKLAGSAGAGALFPKVSSPAPALGETENFRPEKRGKTLPKNLLDGLQAIYGPDFDWQEVKKGGWQVISRNADNDLVLVLTCKRRCKKEEDSNQRQVGSKEKRDIEHELGFLRSALNEGMPIAVPTATGVYFYERESGMEI